MAIDFTTDQQQQVEQLPVDFYRGANFLGRPVTVALAGQEPGGPAAGGSPDALAVGGAPVGPTSTVSPGGAPGPTAGGGTAGLTDLQRAQEALGVLQKTGKLASELTKDRGATGTTPTDPTAGALGGAAAVSGSDALRSFDPATGLMDLTLSRTPPTEFLMDPLSATGGAPAVPGNFPITGAPPSGAGELPGSAIPSGEAGATAGGATTGAAGAGALAAILGLIAQETGNADLGKAASALGLGAGAATTGAGIAATAAGEAVAGGAAGAAALPIGAAWLPILALTMATGEAPDFADIVGQGGPTSWQTFGSRLGQTLGAESASVDALAEALPRVQSQADLANVLSLFKGKVGERVGGYGAGSDPFTIPNLPGAAGSGHEGKQTADFGREVNILNDVIQRLKGTLPATSGNQFDYGSFFNMPGKGLAGSEPVMKATLPDGSVQYGTAAEFEANKMKYQARTIEQLDPGSPEYAQAAGAAGLFQPPGISPQWTQLVSSFTDQQSGGIPPAAPLPAESETAANISDIPGVGVSGGQLFPVA